ncbi:MAG: DUF1013 domain-containing protein [Alphaproteobacteria bacterium]|nr:DUF1013 domain-containing protein [Alphaproteobacteria bacterium]
MAAKQPEPQGLKMPQATSIWLIENTGQTFEQIAAFTGLHAIEVQALADEEVGLGIVGRNPVKHNETTAEELEKAKADSTYVMKRSKPRGDIPVVKLRSKGPRYTPVSKRGDKPDAIAYLLKNHSELADSQICKLVGTTKPTIAAIRERTHANMSNIKPRHPVDLGLCTYAELDTAYRKALKAQGKDPDQIKAQQEAEAAEARQRDSEMSMQGPSSGFDFSNFMNSGIESKSSGAEDDNQAGSF